MDCRYEIIGVLPTGENRLRCRRPECGHETDSAYGPELTHTRCKATGPPTLAEVTDLVRLQLSQERSAPCLSAEDLETRWPEIARRIEICYGNPCGKFNVRLCTDRGSRCTQWQRWCERLAVLTCGWWEESG